MATKLKIQPAQVYEQPTMAPARKPYAAPDHHRTKSHPFGAQSEAAHYLQILPYTVNLYYRYWMFHGDTFSRADKLLLEYLIALGVTEEEAVEKLPHAKGVMHQVATSKQPISPSGDFSAASASTNGQSNPSDGDPRFASIERYADRRPGEDAIAFYQRAWAVAPQPFYRENVEAHDPDLVPAIKERCKNINRNRPKDDPARIDQNDVLPPRRPASARVEAQRARARQYMRQKSQRLR